MGSNSKKTLISLGVAIVALLASLAPGAYAQDNVAGTETVVVSGSRITSSGFAAPTPTTVVGVRDIEQNAQPNLFTTITQLPSLQGSTGTQSGTGGTSAGTNGLSSFNQRALGTIRSLTLLDGQRVVPANVSGIADVSEFPQLLVSRVDVVTGGASASWGSDAVGGVINFVTNKTFNGFKANLQAGITNYSDDATGLFQVAAGAPLFGGKMHVEAAAEFYHDDGVQGANKPGGFLPNNRCCNYNAGTANYTLSTIPQIVNGKILTTTPTSSTIVPCTAAASNCLPLNNRIQNAQPNTTSEYGLINTGALQGYAFDADGVTLSPFNFGTAIAPIYTVPNTFAGTAAGCGGSSSCVGGDLTNTTNKTSLDDPITRSVFYTRLSYAVTPNIEVYGTYNFGNVWTENTPGSTPNAAVNLPCGNAAGGPDYYLTAAVNALCVSKLAANAQTIRVGVSFDKFPQIYMSNLRQMRRYVAGADGDFDAFGTNWTFDTYFQHGENDTSIHIHNILITSRYNNGLDAVQVTAANQATYSVGGAVPLLGSVVCRNPVAVADGCVPFNILGGASPSAASMAWLEPRNGPVSLTSYRQEAAAVSINGKPFKDWAGDIAMAFGAEYREEAYQTVGDPWGNGVSAANPSTSVYPLDPLMDNVNGNNWRAGNFHNGQGNYHVFEGFAEFGIPLWDSPEFGKVDGNIAGRATDYSTSGFVDTWKVGVTWDTPLNGLRFRALQSRDVRAPNLSELFAAVVVTNTNGLTDNSVTPPKTNIQANGSTIGNPALKPEKAQSTELGLVYQPDFIPGFNMALDYYRVAVKGEINTLTAQQQIDLCQLQNNAAFCNTFFLKGVIGTATPNFVILKPFNLASVDTDGFDVEAAYQFDLQNWDIPGNFTARALANHVSKFITDSGVPGQAITEAAGTNGNPLWKVNASQSWRTDQFSFSLTERWFSNGVLNPYGIVCQPGSCPLSTVQHPTYAAMNTPGNLFLDIGGTYKVTDSAEAYFKVDNVADRLAGPIAGAGDNTIGRVYRLGVRINN